MLAYRKAWRLVCAVVLLAGVFTASPAPSSDKDDKKPDNKAGPLDPRGEPKGFDRGDAVSYAVWHDDEGWHFRTTTAKKKHHFKGTIEVQGGTLENVRSFHLEKSGKLSDRWKQETKQRSLTFDFETDEGSDGINFRVSKDADSIRFNLRIDDKEQTDRTFIGRDRDHPKDIPFTLPAHPDKTLKKR